MEALGMILLAIGGIGMFVSGIWLLVVAFQESIWWGLGCILVPFVALIFVAMHWDKAGKPFLVQLACLVPYLAGLFMAGESLN